MPRHSPFHPEGALLMHSRRDLLHTLSAAAIIGASVAGASMANAQGQYTRYGQNQVQYQKFDWRILRTEHFDVHYYPAEAAGAKIAARMAERSYARLSRILNYTFKERKPIVIFASRGDFAQSNVFGDLGEGTGGATDPLHQRNTFFLEMDLAETEHVLTHEMVHVFQFDEYGRGHAGGGLQTLAQSPPPDWFMEGMAEYLSIGPNHPATDAVMRDAALNGNLPTMKQMTQRPDKYFPYRFGEAFWRFVGQRWGDEIIGEILAASPTLGVDRAFKRHTGFDLVELGDEWKEQMQTEYLPGVATLDRPRKVALPLLNVQRTGGVYPVYVAPAFSPDGRQIAYISGGSLLRAEVFLDLYLADATTGKRLKRLTTSTINPEFEELRYVYSQSSFSPDGRTIAFTAMTQGKDVLYLEDVKSLEVIRRLDSGLESMIGPTWSPDGRHIIFSGAKGGFTNLYMIDADGRNLRQLTSGDFAALMPSWSPDGQRVAFVSDRGPNTDFATLKFGKWQINVLDIATGNIDVIPGQRGKNLNPNWSPDGKSLAYISDRSGIAQLYIYDFDKKEHYQITKFINGVQSLTDNSPAITWARQADKIAFTYMDNGDYTIWSIANPRQLMKEPYRDPAPSTVIAKMTAADSAQQRASMAAAALQAIAEEQAKQVASAPKLATPPPPPLDSTNGRSMSVYRGPAGLRASDAIPAAGQPGSESAVSVASMLDSATLALPNPNTFTDEPYKPKLTAEAVLQPQVGYAQNSFGSGVYGATAVVWGDLLGNRQLVTAAGINGTIEDAQLFLDYTSLSQRLSWSAGLQIQPYYILAAANESNVGGNNDQISEELDRYIIRSAFFSSIYPKNRFDRYEIGVSLTNIDKQAEYISSLTDVVSGYGTGFNVDSVKGTGTYDFASPYVAYVSDNALWGNTGPIYGHRYRLQVGTNVGTQNWMSYSADLRRYDAIVFSYLTLATRVYADVNVGPGESLFPQYIGQPGYIRGYDREAYISSNCGVTGALTTTTGTTNAATSGGTCSTEQLIGSRTLLGNAELRFPLLRRLDVGFLPFPLPGIDGLFFYDAGMAWSGGQSITLTRPANYDPDTQRYFLRSFGYGIRVNVFNFAILAFDYAIPRDSFNNQGYWWFSIMPSF
jgi:Tol biopolymer transport system component